MATKETVSKVMQTLIDIYQPNMTPAKQKAYQSHLSRLPDSVLTQAVDKIITESVFFPKIAEIYQVARDIPELPDNTAEEMADKIAELQRRRADLMDASSQFYGEPTAWLDLAADFEKIGLVENAEAARRKAYKINATISI